MVKLTHLASGCKGVGSIGIDCFSDVNPKIRASVESVITWHLVNSVKEELKEKLSDRSIIVYGRNRKDLVIYFDLPNIFRY